MRGLTAEGVGLMYSQAHVTAQKNVFDNSHPHVNSSDVSEHGLCDRGNEKGSPGKHGGFLTLPSCVEIGNALALSCVQGGSF